MLGKAESLMETQYIAFFDQKFSVLISNYTFFLNNLIHGLGPDLDTSPDPHVFGPPGSGSGSISQRYGSGSGSRSFPFAK